MSNTSELKAAIDQCMIKDRFHFQREFHARKKRSQLQKKINQSINRVEARRAAVPSVVYPEALPVVQMMAELKTAISENQVVVVAGETGSGKTTQLPKICLELGRGVFGTIGHTQPRRVAARTVSNRIAEELGEEPGLTVGYQVRFTDTSSPTTLIKVMTDGILLAETGNDRFLEQYDTLIIDEAHERSLNIDFLLGYLKRILPKRPDLKVIITSATIDVDRFSKHFSNAPVVEVSGRTYPVDILYRPPVETDEDEDSEEQVFQGVLDALKEIEQTERGKGQAKSGDVLVFLSGEREIRELARLIRKHQDRWEILPLYSRLSVKEQNRVFAPHRGRRIVLATNVAETSLTVPGIRYVIDPGLARISRYSVRSKVQQLPIERISQASANQRAGRCGRVSEGVCIRLYSEEDFCSRDEFTQPEILRTNLASVILQMLQLKLGDMNKFPFLERPAQKQINDGFQLLFELQAVDKNRAITKVGREMASYPVDLRFARMLIEANKNGCLAEMLIIASALAIQDPRERPHEKQQAADQVHRTWWHEQSDFMAFVNLWHGYEEQRQSLKQGALRRYCRDHFLSFLRMREWRDVHRQLRLMTRESGYRENREPGDYASIHRAILAGLIGNIGEKTDDGEYTGARNRKHYIFPGSSQFKCKPRWIVSGELTETTRLYARNVAQIESEWIEPLSTHLVKRTYFEPHFDAATGQVFAYEQVLLYGLVIVKRRRVDFASVSPIEAREVFIQSALVEQQLRSKASFYKHNRRVIRDVEQLESKARKRDILVDSKALYQFYDERLPAGVVSQMDLEQIAKKPRLASSLKLEQDNLMRQKLELSAELYPDTMKIAGAELKLDYRFNPEDQSDGINLSVPRTILRQVSREQLDWVIPGLLREKCLALVKSLPKSIRRNFVPAPDYVDKALENLEYDGRALNEALAERLFRVSGNRVNPQDFQAENLDRHLMLNIQVLDDKGKVLGASRNLDELVSEFGGRDMRVSQGHQIEKDGITDWDFGELPDQVDVKASNLSVKGYPALVDKGESVAIEIVDNQLAANRLNEGGLLRLVMLQLKDQRKYVEKNIPGFDQFALYYATRGNRQELLDDLVSAIFRYTFIEDRPAVMTEQAFQARLKERQQLVAIMNEASDLLRNILATTHRVEGQLDELETDLNRTTIKDVRQQLSSLLAPGFLKVTPLKRLREFPRYLRAIEYRLDKLQGNLARDRESIEEVARFAQRIEGVESEPDVQGFRWLIEEYRVSLFAQPIGTIVPVSAKRLEKAWQDVAGTVRKTQ